MTENQASNVDFELPPIEERPLVTFALFAYNQEKYIREAVEGAFSQTYEPLEIILSDDCSTDRTFEIMQEMAAEYTGPHELIVRRNVTNKGLIDHVNLLNDISNGEYIIAAAGDDVSISTRAEIIVKNILTKNNKIYSIHTPVYTIDSSGVSIGVMYPKIQNLNITSKEVILHTSGIIGASHAWSRRISEIFGKITEIDTYEDLIIAYRSHLLGEVKFIDAPLVKYRLGVGISSNYGVKINDSVTVLNQNIKHSRRIISTYKQRARDSVIARRYGDWCVLYKNIFIYKFKYISYKILRLIHIFKKI